MGPLGAFLATSLVAAVAFIPDNFWNVLPHTITATLGTLTLLGPAGGPGEGDRRSHGFPTGGSWLSARPPASAP